LVVFSRDSNGVLVQSIWNGLYWPTFLVGGDAFGPLSAVVHGSYLKVFSRTREGFLVEYSSLDRAHWTQRTFPTIALSSGPSAVMYDTLLRVFARGRDGNLMHHYWTGTHWVPVRIGGQIGGGPGAVDTGFLRVFYRAIPSGTPWMAYWDGNGWRFGPIGGAIT
jgi:hypothetical protein